MDNETAGEVTSRRPATLEEARALAHPLRLRILRLCLDEAKTNQQLADHLGKDPATVLHHVRTLVATGFLAGEGIREGSGGALEKPYRATGKSWSLDIGDHQGTADAVLAGLDAFRAELLEGGPDASRSSARLGLTLNAASVEELKERISSVLDEFADRDPDEEGEPYGLFWAIHRSGRPRTERRPSVQP